MYHPQRQEALKALRENAIRDRMRNANDVPEFIEEAGPIAPAPDLHPKGVFVGDRVRVLPNT